MTSRPNSRPHVTEGLSCWCGPVVESYGSQYDEDSDDVEDEAREAKGGSQEVADQIIEAIDSSEEGTTGGVVQPKDGSAG